MDCSKLAIYWKNYSDVTIWQHDIIIFDVVLFLLSSLVIGPSFMSIPSLVLELWQFSFIRNWMEIQKLEIHLSEFCPISGDWDKLGLPNLARMSLMKNYRPPRLGLRHFYLHATLLHDFYILHHFASTVGICFWKQTIFECSTFTICILNLFLKQTTTLANWSFQRKLT